MRGILRAARAALALVSGGLLLIAPLLVAAGWREAFLWVPDLAVALGVLGALLVAMGALRLVKLAQLHRTYTADLLPPPHEPDDNLISEPSSDRTPISA